MGAFAIRVVPVVRAVDLVIRYAGMRTHAPAERLSRRVCRHIVVFRKHHIANGQCPAAELYTVPAIAHVAPERHPGAVILPRADRTGLHHHAIRVGMPSGRIGIAVVAVGREHIPRHDPLGNDPLPTECAVAALIIVAENADVRPFFRLREVEPQAQRCHLGFLCGKRNVQCISLGQLHVYILPVQFHGRYTVVVRIVLFGKCHVLRRGIDRQQIGVANFHAVFSFRMDCRLRKQPESSLTGCDGHGKRDAVRCFFIIKRLHLSGMRVRLPCVLIAAIHGYGHGHRRFVHIR